MNISAIEFIGAKYHDVECSLYLDELPDVYYEKDGDIYVKTNKHCPDVKSKAIVKLEHNRG